MPVARDLLAEAVPAGESVGDHQGREGEGHQGGHLVADLEAERGFRADLLDHTDKHAAGAGHRVLHLAPGGDDVEHRRAHRSPVTAVHRPELAEARGVQVESLYPHPDLVGVQLGVGVQALGGLRQDTRGPDHAVQTDRRAGTPYRVHHLG